MKTGCCGDDLAESLLSPVACQDAWGAPAMAALQELRSPGVSMAQNRGWQAWPDLV